jgi:hypothetical protein
MTWDLGSSDTRQKVCQNVKTRHFKNRLLEKCLISYWFINLELFLS